MYDEASKYSHQYVYLLEFMPNALLSSRLVWILGQASPIPLSLRPSIPLPQYWPTFHLDTPLQALVVIEFSPSHDRNGDTVLVFFSYFFSLFLSFYWILPVCVSCIGKYPSVSGERGGSRVEERKVKLWARENMWLVVRICAFSGMSALSQRLEKS